MQQWRERKELIETRAAAEQALGAELAGEYPLSVVAWASRSRAAFGRLHCVDEIDLSLYEALPLKNSRRDHLLRNRNEYFLGPAASRAHQKKRGSAAQRKRL